MRLPLTPVSVIPVGAPSNNTSYVTVAPSLLSNETITSSPGHTLNGSVFDTFCNAIVVTFTVNELFIDITGHDPSLASTAIKSPSTKLPLGKVNVNALPVPASVIPLATPSTITS